MRDRNLFFFSISYHSDRSDLLESEATRVGAESVSKLSLTRP